VASTNDLAVLHYDSDFDILREKQIFDIRTEWAAPRGTVDGPTSSAGNSSAPEQPY
jgi:hypothetical protein